MPGEKLPAVSIVPAEEILALYTLSAATPRELVSVVTMLPKFEIVTSPDVSRTSTPSERLPPVSIEPRKSTVTFPIVSST